MAYRFPLATLLRVRTIQEEREERLLQQILTELAHTARLLATNDETIARVGASRGTKLTEPISGSDVHSHYGELDDLQRSRTEMLAHQAKLQELKTKQIAVYQTVRQSREMLSGLNDAQRAEHRADLAKREQKALDDNFASRRHLR